jgi:uncharacterized protein YjiS (DUF1127 family)
MTFEPRPYDLFAPTAPAGNETARPCTLFETVLVRACSWLAQYNERHRQRIMLRTLDDRLLSDIGLSRADVSSETAKWPWQI